MPHRITHTIDIVLGVMLSSVSAIATYILAMAETPEQVNELSSLFVPLTGALIASGGMIMLNPAPETRRIVIGRSALALVFGTTSPQVIGLMHPTLANLLSHPWLMLPAATLLTMIFYAVSRPFTEGLYRRSRFMAWEAQRELERRVLPKPILGTPPAVQPEDDRNP